MVKMGLTAEAVNGTDYTDELHEVYTLPLFIMHSSSLRGQKLASDEVRVIITSPEMVL